MMAVVMEGMHMTAYTGTQDVEPGLYLNLKTFRLTTLERAGTLPGSVNDRFGRVPMLLMLAAAPLVGLAYVVFLPFIGFVAVAALVGGKVMQFAAATAEHAGRARRPAWAPLAAFLSRHKPAPAPPEPDTTPAADEWSASVEKHLYERDGRE
jgi:hypothetical protein